MDLIDAYTSHLRGYWRSVLALFLKLSPSFRHVFEGGIAFSKGIMSFSVCPLDMGRASANSTVRCQKTTWYRERSAFAEKVIVIILVSLFSNDIKITFFTFLNCCQS